MASDDFRSAALGMNKTPEGRVLHRNGRCFRFKHTYQFMTYEGLVVGELIWTQNASCQPHILNPRHLDGTPVLEKWSGKAATSAYVKGRSWANVLEPVTEVL